MVFSIFVGMQFGAAAEFVSHVHVCPRGDSITLKFEAGSAGTVHFDVSGLLASRAPVVDGIAEFTVDTLMLRPGDYLVRGVPEPASEGDAGVYALTVGPAHDVERVPVWRWGGGEADPAWWRARGFTGGFTSSIRSPWNPSAAGHYFGLFDRAARQDFELGLYISPVTAAALEKDESVLTLRPDGDRFEKPYPLEPAVVEYCKEVARSWLENLREFPALRHVMFHSEWQQPFGVNPVALELAQAETGLDLGSFLTDTGGLRAFDFKQIPEGILGDDDPNYRFLQWWWQRGHGTAPLNAMLAGIVKGYRPDVITWHEPYRLAPVRNSHKGLDCIATWTYGHPDIKRLVYTTYLQAVARLDKQLVQQDITLFLYGRFVVPLGDSSAEVDSDSAGGDPYFTAGPDYAREAIWLVLSQRPDILAFYSAGRLSPDNPTLDPSVSSPETFEAIGQTCEELVEPYGPAILRATRVRARTAVLMSAAATWFNRGKSVPGYANEQTLPYATLLMMNHVPFDVLLDEDVSEGALDSYEILAMPRASTLTASVHERVRRFGEAGKRVIAQDPLPARLPGVTVTEFDFSHQARVDGKHLAKGDAVTAEEDRAIMEKYAAELAPLVADVPRPADAASPRVLTNSLESGGVLYHFFVNDGKTYGPRFGQHKLHFELGVAQTAEVSVAIDGRPILYDAMQRAPIDYIEENGRAKFELRLPAARGKLVAQLREPMESVEIVSPERAEPGQTIEIAVTVKGKSGEPIDGAIPVQVDFYDPLNCHTRRYTATEKGLVRLKFTPALNDPPGRWVVKVSELIAGKSAQVAVETPT
ncbi:MAG TPA: hypothetical protein VMZ06_00670 [Candidatus Bathyarchaeia archaeon]|nr:hypothetical protein [Candidatus Bathyarchaeia archaeon]